MDVTLVAYTKFMSGLVEQMTGWDAEGVGDSQDLAEFAGRACYQSWSRPNPKTASNEGYVKHIIEVQHGSVFEHGAATFYVTGVSRSLTHELVRHRHHSYSQLSQRFVNLTKNRKDPSSAFVTPPLFEGDGIAAEILEKMWERAVDDYEALEERAFELLGDEDLPLGTQRVKMAREAARAVLPNMTPTAIVVTGNHRAWREFLVKRGSLAADMEIRRMAIEVFRELSIRDDNLYQDFHICNTGDIRGKWLCNCTDAHAGARLRTDVGDLHAEE